MRKSWTIFLAVLLVISVGFNAFFYFTLDKAQERMSYDEEQYSQLVDERNEAVSRHNELVEKYNQLMKDYNEVTGELVSQYQQLAAENEQYKQLLLQIQREAEQAQSYEGLMDLLRLILGW